MAEAHKSPHVNFDKWEHHLQEAKARYHKTKAPDDYKEAENQRVRLKARLLAHRDDEIAMRLQERNTKVDQGQLQAIYDRLTTRIGELDQQIAR
jgi:hypothetical protein